MRQRDLPILAALAAFLLTPAQVPAQAQAPTIKFTENTPLVAVTLKPGAVDTTTLAIQNGGLTAATISSVSFTFVGTPAPKVTLAPRHARLEPGAVTAVQVVLADAGGRGISGTGYLVLRTDTGPLTRVMKISPPAGTRPVTKWTTTASMKCWGWIPMCSEASLPFPINTTAPAQLLRKTAAGSYNGRATARRHPEDESRARLELDTLDGPGTYTGLLPVGTGSVDLTLHVRHWVGWLVLTLTAGVLFGLWQSHYSSVRRALWEFRAECGELLERLGGLKPVADLTPETAATAARVSEALAAVRALGSTGFKDVEQRPEYTAALGKLREVHASLAAWSELPPKLARVRQALADAEIALQGAPRPRAPAGQPLGEPEIVQWARANVTRQTLPLEEAPALSTRLDQAADTLKLVVSLNTAAALAQKWLDALRGQITDPTEKAGFEAAIRKLNQAWWEVWTSDDPAHLVANQTQKALDEVQKALAQLNHHLPAEMDGLDAAFADERVVLAHTSSRLERAGAARRAERAEVNAQRNWRWYRQLVESWDWAFLILAVALAILTGLKAFYFDKEFFGTAADYTGALLWGFGVKTALDLILATAAKFFGVRSVRAALSAPPPVALTSTVLPVGAGAVPLPGTGIMT